MERWCATKIDKKKAAADFILIAGIAVIAVLIFLFRSGGGEGGLVLIKRNGELKKSLPVAQNAEYDVDGLLTVIIENGKVWVINAVCEEKLCEKSGEISKSGEAIVCLPNGITVEIVGGEYDFIV